jgi:prepilin-type N-terminal cleavage/methylation domain-containing protein
MLSQLSQLREEREEGFTLIELLVVILIIGILSAIAIPAFLNQRKSAVDASVQSDVRNIAMQIETLLVQKPSAGYITTSQSTNTVTITVKDTAAATTSVTATSKVSDGTVITTQATNPSEATRGYVIRGTNTGGDRANRSVTVTTPATYTVTGFEYWSNAGGLQK